MKRPLQTSLLTGLLATTFALCSGAATAAPGNSMTIPGSADALVVEPVSITPIDDLRFGTMLRPATAGVVVVAADGTVTSNIDISTFPTGRGPSRFTVLGDPNRRFVVFTPNRIDISNGTATMAVDRFRTNLILGFGRFNAAGSFDLYIGGRLNVGANQQVGNYAGTFDVTVLYL